MGGGKKGKKGKSAQSKKGKTKESTKPPQLPEEDKGGQENVSSQGDLPVVEKTLTDLHLEGETEQIADIKNNNKTPPTKSQPEEAQPLDVEKTKTVEGPKISSSLGLDRRKSLSNLEISSPRSEKEDATVVEDQQVSSVNYNNNVAQKMTEDQKEDSVETPRTLVPMKHSLEHSWTLW